MVAAKKDGPHPELAKGKESQECLWPARPP